jgi:hypothetical protein
MQVDSLIIEPNHTISPSTPAHFSPPLVRRECSPLEILSEKTLHILSRAF